MGKLKYDECMFAEKYVSYNKLIYRLGIIMLKNKNDAEDVVQETFIKLFSSSPDFKSAEHEKNWIIRVAVNLCKNKLRSFWHRKIELNNELYKFHEDAEPEMTDIFEQINKLSEKNKAVIYLYYIENYNMEEISNMLKIKLSVVKMRLKRSRELLKLEMEENSYEER